MLPPGSLGDAIVLPFLNGLDHVDLLRGPTAPSHVATGTIRVEAERVSPGVVVHRSPFALAEVAAGRADPAQVQLVGDALAGRRPRHRAPRRRPPDPVGQAERAGADRTVHHVLRGALGRCRATSTGTRSWPWSARSPTPPRPRASAWTGTQVLAFLRQRVPDQMRSSMQKDAAAGLPLELDAIGGAVLRAAARGGTAAPTTQRLVEGLAPLADPEAP